MSMSRYALPTTVEVSGTDYPIRTDFRVVLDVFTALNDAEIPASAYGEIIGRIMFPGWNDIPAEQKAEAIKEVVKWIDHGNRDDGKPHPRLVDWEQDADLIASAINSQTHQEIRAVPYMHWWTFLGYFMGIGESVYSTVLHIRSKKAEHKKLEKWEQEYYRKNRDIIDIKKRETAEEKAEREAIERML